MDRVRAFVARVNGRPAPGKKAPTEANAVQTPKPQRPTAIDPAAIPIANGKLSQAATLDAMADQIDGSIQALTELIGLANRLREDAFRMRTEARRELVGEMVDPEGYKHTTAVQTFKTYPREY